MGEEVQDLDLRHVAWVLRRRAPLIVGFVIVALIAGYALSARQTKQYSASATVRIGDPNAESVFNGGQFVRDPQRQVDTEIEVIRSQAVADKAEQSLGERASQISSVAVSSIASTDVVEIEVTATTPDTAADAANALANFYVDRRRAQITADLDRRAAELREKADALTVQIQNIDAQVSSAGDQTLLVAQRQGLVTQQQEFSQRASEFEIESGARSGNVEVVETAEPNQNPVSPKPFRDAALAGILAAMLGVAGAMLLDRLDEAVKLEEVPDRAKAPVLGVVPLRGKRLQHRHLPDAPRVLVEPKSLEAEAFRSIRTSLRFSNLSKAKQTLVVTSASGSEGKSTVTANLAVSLADAGLRVVAVSADLRRPTLGQFFGIDERSVPGLTSVLLGDTPLEAAMVNVPLRGAGQLLVLPAGATPPNPAELLGSHLMGELVESLENSGADFVLLDCPPVLPVADPLATAQFADGVVLVAVPGQTKAHSLVDACDKVRQVGVEIVGVVVNGLSAQSAKYGYYHRYEYYGPTVGDSKARPSPTWGNGRSTPAPSSSASAKEPANGS